MIHRPCKLKKVQHRLYLLPSFRHKCYWFIFFLFLGGMSIYPVPTKRSKSLEAIQWPIDGHKVIDTHLYSWNKSFFTINKDDEIVHITFPKGKLQKKKIF